jgi:hypothetical protein
MMVEQWRFRWPVASVTSVTLASSKVPGWAPVVRLSRLPLTRRPHFPSLLGETVRARQCGRDSAGEMVRARGLEPLVRCSVRSP